LHAGIDVYKWFGDKLEEKLGDPDVTFKQVRYGIIFYHIPLRKLCGIE